MNETQLNFLYWQNVHIWHFIKVSHKRSLLFLVVPTIISRSKTKIFADYDDKIKTKNVEVYTSFECFSSVTHFNSLVFAKRIT